MHPEWNWVSDNPQEIVQMAEEAAAHAVNCHISYAAARSLFHIAGCMIDKCETEEEWQNNFKIRLKVKLVWLAGNHTSIRASIWPILRHWIASDASKEDFKLFMLSFKAYYYFLGGNILPNSIGRARS